MARPITYDPSAVLDHAIDLFWDNGFQAVSVDELVRGTGLNRHSLYSRYGNKVGLLKAALERYSKTCLQGVERALSGAGTALQRIDSLLSHREPDCTDDFFRRMLEQGCLCFRICAELRDTALEQAFQGQMRQLEDMIAGVIREGQAEGSIRSSTPPEDLAAIVMDGYLAPLLLPSHPRRKRAILSILN